MGKWLFGQDLEKLWENGLLAKILGSYGKTAFGAKIMEGLGKMALFAKILESLEIGFLVMVLESLGVAKILKVVLKCVCTDVSYMPEAFEPRFWSGLSPLPLI